jgi:hypothetical protein
MKKHQIIEQFIQFNKNTKRVKVRHFTLPHIELTHLKEVLGPYFETEKFDYEFIRTNVVVKIDKNIVNRYRKWADDSPQEWVGWRHIKYVCAMLDSNMNVYTLKTTAKSGYCR